MKYSLKHYCRNCFYPLAYGAKFCAHCGQRDTDGKVRLHELLQRFWNTTFHLESKFLRMVWHLLVPGKVTIAYFQGKQKRYPHPVQFFLLTMFFILFYLSTRIPANGRQNIIGLNLEYDQTKGKLEILERLAREKDSLPPDLRQPSQRRSIDTLLSRMEQKERLPTAKHDSITLWSPISGFTGKMAILDILKMSNDSLCQYYHLNNRFDRLLVRQLIKTAQENNGLIKYYLGSSSWTLLVLIGIMSAYMQWQYRKQKRRYVEHFVLLLHMISGFLFLLALLAFLKKYGTLPVQPVWSVWWLWLGLYWAFKQYYGLSWARTFRKWLAFSALCILCLVVVFITSLGISLLLF